MDFAQRFDHYTHGGYAVLLAYLLVGACVLAGLIRSRASAGHYIALPFITIPVLVVAGFADWIVESIVEGPMHLKLRFLQAPASLTLAGIAVPPEDESKHFKLIGSTGTGKSTALRELLHGALERGDRAVIADPDGGYLSRFYDPSRGDVILNPFDARSAKWDLFAELKSPYDVEQLARSLMPERGGDPQWPGFARTFFGCVTRQAHAAGVRDMGELYRLLTHATQEEVRLLVAGTAAAPFTKKPTSRCSWCCARPRVSTSRVSTISA